jgi:hypothetical protein
VRAAVDRAASLRELGACLGSAALAELSDQPVSLFLESLPWDGPGVVRLRKLVDELDIATLGALGSDPGLRRRLSRRPSAEKSLLIESLRTWIHAELAAAPAVDVPGASDRPAPGWSEGRVRAWASEARLERCLGVPALALESTLAPASRRWLWSCPTDTTISTLFALPTTAPGLSPRASVPFAVKQAAAAWLDDQLARARAGQAAEAAAPLPPPEPADSPLGALSRGWHEERSRLLDAGPIWPPEPGAVLELAPDEAMLQWTAGARSCLGSTASPVVELPLDGGASRLRCDCGASLAASCPRRVQALRHAMVALSGPDADQPELRSAVLALQGQTSWERELDRLDQLLVRPPPPEERELGWRFDADPAGLPRLRPVGARWDAARRSWALSPVTTGRARQGAAGPVSAVDHVVLGELSLLDASAGTPPPALQRAVVARAVAALVGSPRVFDGEGAPLPVQRRTLGLVLRAAADGGLELGPALDGVPQPLGPLLDGLSALSAARVGVLQRPSPRELAVVELAADVLPFFRALAERGHRYPPESAGGLLDRVPAFAALLPVVVDESLAGPARPPRWRWAVRLRLLGGESLALQVELRVLPVPGGVPRKPGQGPPVVYGVSSEGRIHVQRELDEERRACGELLDELGLDPAGAAGDATWTLTGRQRVLGFVQHLERSFDGSPPVGDGVEVRWHGEQVRVVAEAQADQLAVAVRKGQDWFGLAGGLQVDELEIALGALLDQVRRGGEFVRLSGNDFVRLDARLRERLAALEEGRQGGGLGLLPSLDALAELGAQVEGDADWKAEEARIRDALAWQPPLPPGLRATLRPYQRQGFAWLARRARLGCGAILADDMGLGKTVQTIALLLHCAAEGPALVVAPTSLGPNWQAELARFAPGLRVLDFRGPRRARLLRGLGPGDVVVTSYALAAREAAPGGALDGCAVSTLVLDEAQALKNAETQRHRAVARIRRRRAVLLTGTPVENREEDLWSLMTFVRPGVLGTRAAFRELLAGAADETPEPARLAEGRSRIAQRVAPFILRRRKATVARELPPRTVQTVELVPSAAEAARYRRAQVAAVARLRQNHAAQNDHAARFDVLAALTRLRQLACHPGLVDPAWTGSSTKLDHVLEQCTEGAACGHRILVFSQFTRFLAVVREGLERRGLRPALLVGTMGARARQRAVERFQSGETPVFLLSLLAGGTGLNLTAADRVIILDPWWNPAAEAQAADRAHRIGQERPVHVLRLVTAGTIEARVHHLQDAKRSMVRTLLGSPASPVDEGGSAELREALVRSLLGRAHDPADPDDPADPAELSPAGDAAAGSSAPA